MATGSTRLSAADPAAPEAAQPSAPANVSPAVLDLIRRHTGISRAEVARRVHVSRQAVSKTVADLVEQGLVCETGTHPNGVGRAPTRLAVVPGGRFAVGIHLDRDGALVTLVDLAGRIVAQAAHETAVLPPTDYVELLGATAESLLSAHPEAEGRLSGCGIGMAGPVDYHAGVATAPNNFAGWRDVPIAAMLGARLGVPVALDKETNMALMAEDWDSASRSSSVVVYVGTGIGGALMLDGEIYRGPHSDAAELGHMIMDASGPVCVCGQRGCVEAFTSPAAIVGQFDGPVGEAAPRWSGATLGALRGIVGLAADGDDAARSVLATAGARLAVAASSIVRLLDLDDIVLTGPLLDELGPDFAAAFSAGVVWTERARARGAAVTVAAHLKSSDIARGAAISVLRTVGV
jgi:predicted NBD/HSP70 family sugar kinase